MRVPVHVRSTLARNTSNNRLGLALDIHLPPIEERTLLEPDKVDILRSTLPSMLDILLEQLSTEQTD